ncbi:unnamed protein product [Adineta ricciae]|uniref:Uncharacterized protein n=1 Tax=Adineta ricciae TaxID=249248 RepID=A0A815EXC9_ADIRI|nr:unnamed protein product [Adineta ricciae]
MPPTCPFNGKNEVMNETSSNDIVQDKSIPIPSHLKQSKYGFNAYLLLLQYVTPFHLIAMGLFLSLFLPTIIIAILSFAFFLYPLIKQVLRYYNYLPVPYSECIIRSTYSARCEGDFVVFLIGIRPNGANPLTKSFKDIGAAFQKMIAELEADRTLGYMGGDLYVSANSRKTATMYVQYWRSYEALQKWTHTRLGTHVKIMSEYMKTDRFEGVNGIWHETYKVRDGEYECIYGNMPPMGLALATQAVYETKLNNGSKRMQQRQKEKEAQGF